jgi:hypothetical protein
MSFMAQFLSRYGKSSFFLALFVILIILSSWDYPGFYSKWIYIGLPLTVINTLVLYAVIYFWLYPLFRIGKFSWKNWGLLGGVFILFCVTSYLSGIAAVSDEEYTASFRRIHSSMAMPYKEVSASMVRSELVSGSVVTALFFFGMAWLFVHWHRKKNLRKRFGQWWKRQSLNTSGVHMLYLSMGWIFWLFFTLSPVLFTGKRIAWETTLLMMVPSILFFYVNLKTSFDLLANSKILLALLVTLCWWGVLLLVKACWFLLITKGFGMPPILDGKDVYKTVTVAWQNNNVYFIMGKTIGTVVATSAFKELIILMASFIYGYDRTITRYRKQLAFIAETRQREQLQQKVMEKEVVDARLQSLKYQINPHFLFNSLNFLYSQSLPLSEELARATMLLSKMMRYGLQENNEEARVSLSWEVEHLQNFIDFNQLRFSNQLQIEFLTEGQVAIRRIMPLLLITFVENAFKYGELHQDENPLQIHLKVDSQQLTFFVRNKKRKGPKEDSTGIGLENIKRRLSLGYPDRHTLIITDEKDYYTTELTITL